MNRNVVRLTESDIHRIVNHTVRDFTNESVRRKPRRYMVESQNSRPIRLTEEELHFVISESVNQILIDEGFWDTMKGAGQAVGGMLKQGAGAVGNKIGQGMQQVGTKIGQGATALGNKATEFGNQAKAKLQNVAGSVANTASAVTTGAKNFARNVGNTVQAGVYNANIQSAKTKAVTALNDFLTAAQKTPGVAGPSTMAAVQNAITQLNSAGGRSASNFSGNVNMFKNGSAFK